MRLSHLHRELDKPGMWPQPEIPLCDQRSQPPLARSYSAVSVFYCQLDYDARPGFSRGNEQLEWWQEFCLVGTSHFPLPAQCGPHNTG